MKKKILWVLGISLVFNALLGYISYVQWEAKNNNYLNNYYDLAVTTNRIAMFLESYLRTKDESYRLGAMAYSESALLQADVFSSYFKNQLGYNLTNNLVNYYSKLSRSITEQKEENVIKQNIEDLKVLVQIMLPNGAIPKRAKFKQIAEQLSERVNKSP